MSDSLQIVFWGCRGSVPSSNAHNVRYGANTTCFEVRSPSLQSRLIVDAGTGINRFAAELREAHAGNPNGVREPIHIFYSHSHWDHIQGFPFFPPLYDPDQTIHLHYHCSQDYRDILSRQMSPPFYPGTMETVRANLVYEPFEKGPVIVDGVSMDPYGLRHTADQRSHAYYITLVDGGPRIALTSDRQEVRDGSSDEIEDRFSDAVEGLDVLIHDAFFTDEDFEAHPDWGHASVSYVVKEGQRLGAKQLCLHHFNPEYDDDDMDALLESARRANGDHSMQISAAIEGESITL